LGAIVSVLVLAVAAQVLLPGASFLFAWPALVAAIAFVIFAAQPTGNRISWALALLLLPLGLGQTAAYAHGLFVAVGASSPQVIALWSGFWFMLGFPLVREAASPAFAKWAASIAVGAGAAAMLFAALPLGNAPIATEVFHFIDANSGRQYRASMLTSLDPWAREARGPAARRVDFGPAFEQPIWLASEPGTAAGKPVVSASFDPTTNRLTMRIVPGATGQFLQLHFKPSAALGDLVINGTPARVTMDAGAWAEIRYSAAPSTGILISFKAPPQGSLEVQLLEADEGWPANVRPLPAMTAAYMPWRNSGMAMTLVRTRSSWPEAAR